MVNPVIKGGLASPEAGTYIASRKFARCNLAVGYNKLWKLLIDNKMNKSELGKAVKISPNTVAKLGKDETVSLDILMSICQVFHCNIGDIMEYIPDQEHGLLN